MSVFVTSALRSARSAFLCGVAAVATVMPAIAHAQEAEPEMAEPAVDQPLPQTYGNEIVVSALKRDVTLQDVPVAVSVTTQETIERAHIRDIRDLATLVPSLRVGERQNSANTNFFIRGFGNGANNAGIEPSVGVFIDGVYRSRSASQVADLPDVQRVEVLRGPQSTLFGKNASAGVISIVTREPQFDFGGNVEASYGNYNAFVLKGVVTGPISENLAVSIAGSVNKRDGYNRNLGPAGGRVNDRDRWFTRGQLLFKNDAGLKVRLIGDYGEINEMCCGVVNVKSGVATSILTSPLIGGQVNDSQHPYRNQIFTNIKPHNSIKNYGFSGQVDYEVGPLTFTSITALRKNRTRSEFDSDFTSADLLRGANIGLVDLDTFTQEFRVSASILDKLNLVAGAFYFDEKVKQEAHVSWGEDARPYFNALISGLSGGTQTIAGLETMFGQLSGQDYTNQFFAQGQGFHEKDRLKNKNFSLFGQLDFKVTDRLTLTGGINYTDDKKRFSVDNNSTDVFAGLNIPALRNTATAVGIARTIGGTGPGGMATPQEVGAFALANPALFSQIQAGASNATLPLLALRQLQIFAPFLDIPNDVERGRTKDHKFTYTARAAYDASDAVNIYVSYATGYKPSSVNLSRDSRPPLSLASDPAFQAIALPNQTYGSRFANPENSTVYEAGLKAKWSNGSANLAVFSQSIKGFQSNIFNGLGFLLGNAGKQSVKGAEFEGVVKPWGGLTLGVAATYLDPKYNDFKNSAFGDATGIRPADIPKWSMTLSAEYDLEIGDGGHLVPYISYHYESGVQVVEGLPGYIAKNPITGEVLPGGYQPGLDAAKPFRRQVDELDASLTYQMKNGLELAIWGRNLLNDRYISTIFDSPAQSGSVSAYTNQPRTYGGSVRYRW